MYVAYCLIVCGSFFVFFFFQAEDGIRDKLVTGVQTCALPILGTYGFLRFALPLFPAVALHPAVQRVIVALSLIGILYGSVVAMVQPDFKKLIAYSSVAHLGFVMLGIWALTLQSVQGALLVMINHGTSTGALFF